MRTVELIRKKRDGGELSDGEIGFLIAGLASREVADYQWASLLMAIYLRGMTDAETISLTNYMAKSGLIVDLSAIPGPKIDKHSTGGVGDKTSLILAPIAAAAGILVPMVSGRGLGHTGGTLDKLESIPGFRVELDLDAYRSTLAASGLVMIGQTAEIAPADKVLYALRDATATVESIPLITASILSKKYAEGIDGLVLDVKTGLGAFMKRLDDSRRLAESMRTIGTGLGLKTKVLITRMDQPLGNAVGNALEVAESIACLRGEGPSDLVDLSVELAAEMVVMGGRGSTIEEARQICRRTIADGSALARFRSMAIAQGGDPAAIDDPKLLPQAKFTREVKSPCSGFVSGLNAESIGRATMLLGAGRARVDSSINHAVGATLRRKIGDRVETGDALCVIHADSEGDSFEAAVELVLSAYDFAETRPTIPASIVEKL